MLKINKFNFNDIFPDKSLTLKWKIISNLPGAEPGRMRFNKTFNTIAWFSPEQLINKLELRKTRSKTEPKQYELHGHKWDYMLKVLKNIK